MLTTLVVLEELTESQDFVLAGEKKIGDLPFFPVDGGADILDVKANSFAMQLDKVFRLMRGAVYEAGINQQKAVSSLVEVLKDKDKTIADLSDIADDSYLFYKEGDS